MSKVLELEFTTDENKNVRIAIPNASSPVDPAKVDAVMDQLVASGILKFKNGHVVKKAGARLLDSETTTVLNKPV